MGGGNSRDEYSKGHPGEFLHVLKSSNDEDVTAITEYFQPDLVSIVEENIGAVLGTLVTNKIVSNYEAERYAQKQEQSSATSSAKQLVTEVVEKRRGAKHLWRALYNEQDRFHSPNLKKILRVIELKAVDIIHEMNNINTGHILNNDIKSYQRNYKDSVLQQTRVMPKKNIPGGRQQDEELLVDHYTELRIVTNYQHTWGQTEHELLRRGQEHEKLIRERYVNKQERITADQLFRIHYESLRFPKVILISGVPGIGKTMMVQKMLYDWIREYQYKKFSFLFLFKFRDMNLWEEVMNLPEMILKQHSCLRNCIEQILGRPNTVLFIFDGLDESKSHLDFTKKQLCTDICQRNRPANIVSSLMKQTLMEGCSVVITSRPAALDQMDMTCVHHHVEIMGFLEEDRRKYFIKQFSASSSALDAFAYVKQNDLLYTLCYNPAYCWIICSVLKPYFTGSQNKCISCPKTLTQLFVCFINSILTNHTSADGLKLKGLLYKVSLLAFNGVCDRLLVFYDTDLKQHNIEPTPACSSFLFEVLIQDESFQRINYTFLHLTVQEFLGALSYFLASEQNIFHVLESERYQDGRLDILIRFLAGLSHSPTSYLLQKFLGPFLVQKQAEILKWFKDSAEHIIMKLENCQHGKSDLYMNLLKVFHYLFETQNVDLIKEVVGRLNCFYIDNKTLNPVDYYILNYIIVACGGITELTLLQTVIPVEEYLKLKEAFTLCKSISLRQNSIGNEEAKSLSEALQSPNNKIQELNLRDNSIGSEGAKYLFEALQSPDNKIQRLILGQNSIGGVGAKYLSEALQSPNNKIQELNLQGNSIGSEGAKYVSEALQSSNNNMQKLYMSHNKIGTEGAAHLCKALQSPHCKVQEINLSNNTIGVEGTAHLSEGLQSPHCKIQEIDLLSNTIGDEGAAHLCKALQSPHCKVQKITLSENNIGAEGTARLSEGLQSPHCKIQEINLFANTIGAEGATHLCKALQSPHCKVQKINLSRNNIGAEGTAHLSEGLQSPHCKIQEISLADNNIGDEGAAHLFKALQSPHCKMQDITLDCNNIGDKGAAHLFEALQSPHCKIQKINLRYNGIGDKGAAHLSKALQSTHCKIQEINLSWNKIPGDWKTKLKSLCREPEESRPGLSIIMD